MYTIVPYLRAAEMYTDIIHVNNLYYDVFLFIYNFILPTILLVNNFLLFVCVFVTLFQ